MYRSETLITIVIILLPFKVLAVADDGPSDPSMTTASPVAESTVEESEPAPADE